MKYDNKLTTDFNGNAHIKRSLKQIYTSQNAVVAGISKKQICDLSGKVIAQYAFKKKENQEDKSEKIVVYRDINSKDDTQEILPTDYVLNGALLYRGDEQIGYIKSRARNPRNIGFLSVLISLLALVLAFVLLIDIPYANVPRIVVNDDNGYWGEGAVAVLGENVYPEKQGEYKFIIENPHDTAIRYSFHIAPVYDGKILDLQDESAYFPLLFRLRMNNAHLETDEWLSAQELAYKDLILLPESAQSFELEWKWPYESGNDEQDTLLGKNGKTMSLVLYLTAEVI